MPYISRNSFNTDKFTKDKFAIIIISDIKHVMNLITNLQTLLNIHTNNYNIYIINGKHNVSYGYLYNIGYEIAKQNNCKFVIFHSSKLNPNKESIGYYLTYPIDPIVLHKLSNNELILSINMQNFENFNKFKIISSNLFKELKDFLKKNKININYSVIGSYNIIDNEEKKQKKQKNKISNRWKIESNIKINNNVNYYLIN